MLLKDLILLKNEEYKEKRGNVNEQEFTREFILSLSSLGIDVKEYKSALQVALPEKFNGFAKWDCLKEQIYQYYLIDIGEEDNPNIKEVFNCWLNLDTMELSTIKTYNPFEECDNCVMVQDYRILGNELKWNDFVINY